MYRLLFLTGPLKGRRTTVQQGNLLIGRGDGCHVNLDDDLVSPQHAIIEHRGGRPVLNVLQKTNRVDVNGRTVVEHRLRHGDRIEIGGTRMEFFEADRTAPAGQPRRFSITESLAVLAVMLVVLAHLAFMIVLPIWQQNTAPSAPAVAPVTTPEPAQLPEPPAAPKPAPAVAAPSSPPADKPGAPVSPAAKPGPARVTEVMGPEPLVVPENRLPAHAGADPMIAAAKTMLNDARRQIALMNYPQAENLLHQAQMMVPEFTPVMIERAELFAKRRMFADAVRLWSEVMELTEGTSEHEKARKERDRLARLLAELEQERRKTVVPPAEPGRVPVVARPTHIRITSVDPQRFKPTSDYDDLRVIRITLRRGNDQLPINARDVRVTVEFFDRIEGTDRIVPTTALVKDEGLQVAGMWPPGEARAVAATYMVTRGFRSTEQAKTGEQRAYAGYRVSVYYKNELQQQSSNSKRISNL